MSDTFPRQYARTRRLSLGEPKAFRIAPDGTRVVFLRSLGGSDPINRLWIAERSPDGTWTERLACDPTTIFGGGSTDSDLPAAERARRERLREQANGITSFDVDERVSIATFCLAGHIIVAGLDFAAGLETRGIESAPGAYDPRLSPNAEQVAYVSEGSLRVVSLRRSEPNDRILAGDPDENVSWGVADFNAAEEFDRQRGFWWSPDSNFVVAARVDNTPVKTWYIADPAHPSREPVVHRYPVAGSDNAIVGLALFDVATGARVDIETNHGSFPYLVHVAWLGSGLITVWMNRAQTILRTLCIDPNTGGTRTILERSESTWIELTPGTPVLHADGSISGVINAHIGPDAPAGLRTASERNEFEDPQRTSTIEIVGADGVGRPITPPNLQIQRIIHADSDHVVAIAGASRPVRGLAIAPDPSQNAVIEVRVAEGTTTVLAGGSSEPGIHDATVAATGVGMVMVHRAATLDSGTATIKISVAGRIEHQFTNLAEVALTNPQPTFFRSGPRALPCCVLFPSDKTLFGDDGLTKLPVLLDPYGGPHAQRVLATRNAHVSSQWFADQGFIVLVVDGRGTPGLGPDFERAVQGNLADPVLEDQISALHDAAHRYPQMDLSRVGIRGWSFGGYLAALAVLKRPDVFQSAVAGAPVTDWRLYDTGYTERYLGNPSDDTRPYEISSLIPLASGLRRPLMLIHGIADDNVVAAHTLQLSSALLAHGRPHEVLPLSGVTHMTPQEEVAENLLKLQVEFLHRTLRSPELLP